MTIYKQGNNYWYRLRYITNQLSKHVLKCLSIHLILLFLFIIILNLSWQVKIKNQQIAELQNQNNQYAEENNKLKLSITGIGGGTPIEKVPEWALEDVAQKIKNHGLLKYKWKWAEKYGLGYPVVSPEDSYVTSEYGYRIRHGKPDDHKGLDLNCRWDLDVVATHTGSAQVLWDDLRGMYIEIISFKGDDIIITRYCHLSMTTIEALDIVTKGQKIGLIGQSGDTDGSHLHFEVEINGIIVNPVSNTTYKKYVEL